MKIPWETLKDMTIVNIKFKGQYFRDDKLSYPLSNL